MGSDSRTSYSLLLGLRDYSNATAWGRFLREYGPRILAWCRRHGLGDADADEVTGMVLLKLAGRMRHFEYDARSRFRGWLRTVVDSQVREFLAQRRRLPGGPAGQDLLAAVPDPHEAEGLEAELEAVLTPEVAAAVADVRARVEPHTWRAFWRTTCDGRKGAEVAAELGIAVASVHQARSRVARLLREEVARRLDPSAAPD